MPAPEHSVAPSPSPAPAPEQLPWWKSAVVYQIYPRSFADGNGDGIGDLAGVRSHLDHLVWLGVDAMWLSPFYRSPMADFGYDVADHCDVDPLFGTLADAEALIAEAHRAGLRVILDLVPNHTSDQHPWFQAARTGRDSPLRNHYVWRDPAPGGGPPNNWIAAFTWGPAWTFDEDSGQWYLHLFLPQQPDLNWTEPAVAEGIHDVMRFWFGRGVDGFRIDVVHCIGKGPDLPDDEPPWEGLPHSLSHEHPSTHDHIRAMRRLADSYPEPKVLIGETALPSTAMVAPYYGQGDELHLCFNFAALYAPWEPARWRRRIERVVEELDPRQAWPTWVLSNHDAPRHRTRYGGSEARARAAAFLTLGLRGTPFLYAGEELGLEDAVVPEDRVIDPGGRDGCRAPIPWSYEAGHGWGDHPWLPLPPAAGARSVEAQRDDPTSILHLYRRLLSARRSSPALQVGDFEWLDGPSDVLAWRRATALDQRVVAVNMGTTPAELDLAGTVEVSSDGRGEGGAFDGRLDPDHAVILA